MTVKVLQAIFDRDTATFMDMDPKYIINWKDDKIEGEPAFGGGKLPKWNKHHELEIGTDTSCMGVMTFTFLDDSNLICSAEISVANLIKNRGIENWHHCRYEGENSGKFSMRVEYLGEEQEAEAVAETQP